MQNAERAIDTNYRDNWRTANDTEFANRQGIDRASVIKSIVHQRDGRDVWVNLAVNVWSAGSRVLGANKSPSFLHVPDLKLSMLVIKRENSTHARPCACRYQFIVLKWFIHVFVFFFRVADSTYRSRQRTALPRAPCGDEVFMSARRQIHEDIINLIKSIIDWCWKL